MKLLRTINRQDEHIEAKLVESAFQHLPENLRQWHNFVGNKAFNLHQINNDPRQKLIGDKHCTQLAKGVITQPELGVVPVQLVHYQKDGDHYHIVANDDIVQTFAVLRKTKDNNWLITKGNNLIDAQGLCELSELLEVMIAAHTHRDETSKRTKFRAHKLSSGIQYSHIG